MRQKGSNSDETYFLSMTKKTEFTLSDGMKKMERMKTSGIKSYKLKGNM